MSNGFNKAVAEESQEFENIEKAQAVSDSNPQQNTQQAPQNQQQKQENPLDVKDQVGKFIESATQSIFGPTDPAQVQQQQTEEAQQKNEDARKVANIKRFLDQMAADEARLRQQREEEKQKKAQEQQEETQEKQEEEMEKQKKDQSFQQQIIQAEQTKAERKLGVGG